MTENSKKLIELYEKAKGGLLIKNKAAFAKHLGFSRAHVDNIIKSREGVPDEWIKKASQLFNTHNVKDKPFTRTINEDELISESMERIRSLEATIKVLTLKIVEHEHELTKQPFSAIIPDLEEKILRELNLLLGKLHK